MISTNTHTICSFAFCSCTVAAFYAIFWLQSAVLTGLPQPDITGLFWLLLGFRTQYWLLLLFVVGFVLIDNGLHEIDKIVIAKVEQLDLEEAQALDEIKEAERK